MTPNYPEGLRRSYLLGQSAEEQAEIVQAWFLSNYQPFDAGGPWFSSAEANPPEYPAPFATPAWSPQTILDDEFSGATDGGVLAGLAAGLSAQSPSWMLIPDLPQTLVLLSEKRDQTEQSRAAMLADALARLDRVEAALARDGISHGMMGHNSGPPLPTEEEAAQIEVAVVQAREGLRTDPLGGAFLLAATTVFHSTIQKLAKGLVEGIGKGFGQEIGHTLYNPVIAHALSLFHSLNEALISVSHWIALNPPVIPM